MKKLNKAFLVLLAMLAIGFVATSFVACSDDDDSPSTVAVYKDSEATTDEYEAITFYSDKTFVQHVYYKQVDSDSGFTLTVSLDVATGTYSGDPTKDGTVTCTVTKEVDESSMSEATLAATMEALSAGKTSLSITNADVPLKAVTPYEITATISGKNASVVIDDETETYVRQ